MHLKVHLDGLLALTYKNDKIDNIFTIKEFIKVYTNTLTKTLELIVTVKNWLKAEL